MNTIGIFGISLPQINLESKLMLLSPRQMQCLALAAQGFTAKDIAKCLNISYRTVEIHLAAAKVAWCARNQTHLVAMYTAELMRIPKTEVYSNFWL